MESPPLDIFYSWAADISRIPGVRSAFFNDCVEISSGPSVWSADFHVYTDPALLGSQSRKLRSEIRKICSIRKLWTPRQRFPALYSKYSSRLRAFYCQIPYSFTAEYR